MRLLFSVWVRFRFVVVQKLSLQNCENWRTGYYMVVAHCHTLTMGFRFVSWGGEQPPSHVRSQEEDDRAGMTTVQV